MTVLLSPLFNPDSPQIDANGDPRSGAKLFTYLAGTSTKATTYEDSAGSNPHENPIELNANGLAPAPIWLTTGSTYKFVLAPANDTDPPASAILTIDNVSAINDTAAAATSTEWTASGMSGLTYTSATTFTVSGDQTTVLHVGRRLKLTVTAGTVYAGVIRSTHSGGTTTVTVLTDSGSLDAGLSAFSYGIISADNTSAPFISRDQQCGRLVYVSSTSIRLDPQDGNTIWVYSGSNWRRRIIPSAGITVANTNFTGSSTYFVYLYDNAGVLTLEGSTTAPAVDATSGLKIKTGDATRLLVGMVRSVSGSFAAAPQVISWYKRRAIKASGALTTDRTSTSTSVVELNAETQAKFCSWAEEAILFSFNGKTSNDTSSQACNTVVCLDAALTIIGLTANDTVGGDPQNCSLSGAYTVTEGYHYLTLGVSVSANTGTWYAGNTLGTVTVVVQG